MDPFKQKMFEVAARNMLKTALADPATRADPNLFRLISLFQNLKPGSISMVEKDGGTLITFTTIAAGESSVHQAFVK